MIKPVKSLDFFNFLKDPKYQQSIIQMANSKIKATLRNHLDMYELGRGKYYEKAITKIGNLALDVRRGFKMTICPVNGDMLVQVDMCTRITRSDNMAN